MSDPDPGLVDALAVELLLQVGVPEYAPQPGMAPLDVWRYYVASSLSSLEQDGWKIEATPP